MPRKVRIQRDTAWPSNILTTIFIEIKIVTAAIYSNYETSIVDDTGIEPLDGFIGRPTGNKLVLKFKHVQD